MKKRRTKAEIDFEGENNYHFKDSVLGIKEPIPQEINVLFDRYKKRRLILQPDFQREFVWPKKKQKELIRSIWRGIPLPMFYFATNGHGKKEVIDGQQRLTTLFGYLNPKCLPAEIRKKLSIKLTLKDEQQGIVKPSQIKHKILESRIHCVEIQEENLSFQMKYDIFMTLNQGATSLKPQEIRNCVFQREAPHLNEALRRMAKKLSKFTEVRYNRMGGEELALRFITINEWGYEKKISSQLNSDTIINSLTKDRVKDHERQFSKFINRLAAVFPNRCFETLKEGERQPKNANNWNTHIFTGKPNQALFHLLSFYFPRYSSQQFNRIRPKKIQTAFLELLRNKKFAAAVTGSATDKTQKIKGSKDLFEKLFLNNCLGDHSKESKRNISRSAKQAIFATVPYCYLCYGKLKSIGEADHILSWSGGAATSLSNSLLAHKKCNGKKTSLSIQEFRKTDFSIKSRKKNIKAIRKYLECLEKWNIDHPLRRYEQVRKYAIGDSKLF